MDARKMLVFLFFSGHAYAEEVQGNLIDRALAQGSRLRGDLEQSAFGKGTRDVVATNPSKASMLPASQGAPYGDDPYADGQGSPYGGDPSGGSNPFGGAGGDGKGFDMKGFQKMIKQMQEAQKVSQKAEDHFQKKVDELQSQLTWEHLRPAMKKSWNCNLKCADADSGSGDEFQSCLQDCQKTVGALQDQLNQYMQQIVQQEQQVQEYCQQSGKKNQTQMDVAHCTVKQIGVLEKHIPDYKKQISKFMEDAVNDAPPAI